MTASEPVDWGITDPGTERPGPWFSARYPGDCARCGGEFLTGERIRADGAGGYECCVETTGDEELGFQPLKPKEEICSVCRITKPCWC